MRFGLGAVRAWTQPDVAGPDVFEADTLIATLYGQYPVTRRQTANLDVSAGFELIDQTLEFTGTPLSEDDLRVIFARMEASGLDRDSADGANGYSPSEPRFAWATLLEARQGLDILGASKPCGPGLVRCLLPTETPLGRLDGDPTAFILRHEAQLDYRPRPDFLMRLKPRAQYSPDNFLSYE